MKLKFLGSISICLALAAFTSACAGPTSPFGPINPTSLKAPSYLSLVDSTNNVGPKIRFFPNHQVLHNSTPFSLEIWDQEEIPENFRLKLVYNGIDYSRSFLRKSKQEFLDPQHHRLRITARRLRLQASRDHRIQVTYQRTPNDQPFVTHYKAPQCDVFATNERVTNIDEFPVEARLVHLINQYATQKNLNPNFVAGLIAQESGFDSTALSRSRALGLTQITPLGAAEIHKRFGQWPQHPGVEHFSLLQLKLALAKGEIHSGNEWRLNPELSVAGGIEYLDYLNDYWNRPNKYILLRAKLKNPKAVMGDLILASYNSGAARVSEAIEKKGKRFIYDEDLREAKKYVRRVTSYCDYFSHGDQ